MALTVQWANGFEDIAASSSQNLSQQLWINKVLGWNGEYSTYTTSRAIPSFVGSTSGPHLRGTRAVADLNLNASSLTMIPRVFRPVNDNAKMVLGFAYSINTSSTINNRLAIGFKGISGDTIHVKPVNTSGLLYHMGLYINGTLVSTGTAVEVSTGSPWVYIELFVNKTAGTVTVKVSGVPECSGTMPVGFVNNDCEITVTGAGEYSFASWIAFDDMVYYTDSDPVGIIKVDGFFKTGDVVAGFNDSKDGGSATTTGVNTSGFSAYRASATVGQEDKFSYNNILPTGVQANSILAVIPSVLASSGSYTNANLELRFTSGATVQTTDVSPLAKPFTPQLITGPVLHTDPNTGLAWVRENVQTIQTGYRVKA